MKQRVANDNEVNVVATVGMRCLPAVFVFSALFMQVEAAQATQPPRDPILNDLKYLCLGVRNFESANGSLPMATSDANPPCSWRVAILPFLEYVDVPDGYDFGIPWNAPGNRNALEKISECFTHHQGFDFTPYFPNAPRPTDSYYLAVVDDRTMWPPNRKSNSVARDGANMTVLLIEAPEMQVPWTQPRDLNFDEAIDLLGKPVRRYANRWFWVVEFHGYQRAVGYLDGHTQQLAPMSAEFASALLTRHGGEGFTEDSAAEHYLHREWPRPIYVYKWPRIVGCSLVAVVAALSFSGFYMHRRRRLTDAAANLLAPVSKAS